MKFTYDYTNQEIFRYLNIQMGILHEKILLKIFPKKKVKKKTEIIIKYYLVCSSLFFFIAFFDTLLKLEWLAYVAFFLFFFLITLNTFWLFQLIKKYQKHKKYLKKGEIKITKECIIDKKENGKSISRTWDEVKWIAESSGMIYLFANSKVFFFFPADEKSKAKIEKILNELPNDLIIHKRGIQSGLLKWLSWIFYILLPILSIWFYGSWYDFNLNQIEQEMQKINDSSNKIDKKIYSYEKFGVIEKMLKEYYEEFQTTRLLYEQNNAENIFSAITIDLLKNNPNKLEIMYKDLEVREESANKSLNHIIDLLDERKVMKRIERKEWGENFNIIFRNYALTDYDSYYHESWIKERNQNEQKMLDVKRAFEILVQEKSCWYIENDKLFMCDEFREEYNKIHDKITEKENYI